MSRGLGDLYGYLAFLRAAPYNIHHWFSCALREPYVKGYEGGRARVMDLLQPGKGGLMWRSSKASLPPHELGIPPQEQRSTQLHLSAIERHFYTRQHQARAKRRRAFIVHVVVACTSCLHRQLEN